jgi:hypothetical protein
VGAGPGAGAGAERGRDGYTFWERYWASLTVSDLPPRPAPIIGDARPPASVAAPGVGRTAGTARLLEGGWFPLRPVPAGAGLRAGDDDDVLAAASSPAGTEFFVRPGQPGAAWYRVEVVVRQEGKFPALIAIRYPTAAGQQFLLVPIADMRFGAAIAQVNLPGLESGAVWEASGPRPVADAADWTAEAGVIARSIHAAATEGTRGAWRAVRDAAPGDLQTVIDRFLR